MDPVINNILSDKGSVISGNPYAWKIMSRVQNKSRGVEFVTEIMNVPTGMIVKTSTVRNGTCSETMVFVPGSQFQNEMLVSLNGAMTGQ